MMKNEKGANEFDKICHMIYDEASSHGVDAVLKKRGIRCSNCGGILETYYCEERLYVVRCEHCRTITLVKAPSPLDAAYRARAVPIVPAEEFDALEVGVFWKDVPINDPPEYVGNPLDDDFPEEMRYGMMLPCPATDGEEYVKKEDADNGKD